MDASRAKGVLEGIVSLACRELNIDPKLYRIKPGGEMLGHSVPEWYVTVVSPASAQSVPRNTKRAKRLKVVKTHIMISDGILKVHQWDASRDWMEGNLVLYESPADDMKARKKVADYMKQAILHSQQATNPSQN